MAMRPIVDVLERELGDRIQVMRINALGAKSRGIDQRLGFRVTPSYAIYDGEGNEVWRSQGRIERGQVMSVLEPFLVTP